MAKDLGNAGKWIEWITAVIDQAEPCVKKIYSSVTSTQEAMGKQNLNKAEVEVKNSQARTKLENENNRHLEEIEKIKKDILKNQKDAENAEYRIRIVEDIEREYKREYEKYINMDEDFLTKDAQDALKDLRKTLLDLAKSLLGKNL